MSQTTATRIVCVRNPVGLHMRPARAIATMAGKFSSRVQIGKGHVQVDATSLLDIMTLVAEEGDEVEVTAEGPDAQAAVDELANFIASDVTEPDSE